MQGTSRSRAGVSTRSRLTIREGAREVVRSAMAAGLGADGLPEEMEIEVELDDLDRLVRSTRRPFGLHVPFPLYRDAFASTAAGFVAVLQSRPVRSYGNRVVLAAYNRYAQNQVVYTVLGSYNLRVWQTLGTLALNGMGPGDLTVSGLSHRWVRVQARNRPTRAEFDAVLVFSAQ